MTIQTHTLVPFIVASSLVIIKTLCAYSNSRAARSNVYQYPRLLAYLFAVLGLVFVLIPFAVVRYTESTSLNLLNFELCLLPFSVSGMCASLYFFRFKLVIDNGTLIIRGFVQRAVSVKQIDAVMLQSSAVGRELLIYFSDGSELRLGEQLTGFDQLIASLQSQIEQRISKFGVNNHQSQRRRRMPFITKIAVLMVMLPAVFLVFLLCRYLAITFF